ncbi:MAG: NAD(P)H-quinone oxidoreductase [Pseudomonadota bacterium]
MNNQTTPNATMRAIEITAPGGPEVLALCMRPRPTPQSREVLIRVDAAGVNRPDVLQRRGLYPPPPGASDLPGLEVAGRIVAAGPDAGRFSEGDAVCALLPGGGYAEFATVDARCVLPVPAGLSPVEAAALPETVFTVWANVFDDAGLKAGERLLVHGGTSGIGATAIAIARARGADVVATAGSAEKVAAAQALGAGAAYHYEKDPWDEVLSADGGVDVVLDMAGGDFAARNLKALAPGGRHVSIAFLRGASAEISLFDIMRKRLRLSGSTMKARDAAEKGRLAEAIEREVWPLYADGRVRPAIDRTFPLAQAADAHRHMEAGAHVGKIVLTVTDAANAAGRSD